MPEESFEQQARSRAEGFTMEPQAGVWQRIEAAIAPPKRKRRALLWWWLLPLGLAGGLGFWLLKDQKILLQNKIFAKPIATIKPKVTDKNGVVNDDAKSVQKSNKDKAAMNRKYLKMTPKTKADFFIENNELNKKETNVKKKDEVMPFQPRTRFFVDKNAVKETDVKNKSQVTEIQSQISLSTHRNESADSSKMVLQQDIKTVVDTAKTDTTIAIKTNDSLKQNKDSSAAASNKKQKKKKWQTGVVAELGATTLGNGLFANQSANSVSAASNPSGNFVGNSFLYSGNQKKKMGVDAALGVSVRKDVSKQMFFSGQIIYRYQQFGIHQILFSPATVPENFHVDNNITYRFQFATIYAGIGIFVLHKKNTSVALQAGVDNSWLLSMRQKQSLAIDSLASLTVHDFRRWQPFFNIAVPVGIYSKNNRHWQLSPFLRRGLRNFQKSNGSYQNNSLSSAGIQAIYFFK